MKYNVTMEEAVALFLQNWPDKMAKETVPIEEALGRVLAESMYARCDMPFFRASAMDGVCVKSALFEDGKAVRPETWQRGREYEFADTGDDFPDAYDSVIPIEDVTFEDDGMGLRFSETLVFEKGMRVRPKGFFLKEGQLIKEGPAVLGASDVAALAMGNHASVPVYRKPTVAFIPTGSELIEPGETMSRGKNVNSNRLLAAGMLSSFGAAMRGYPIIRDERATLKKAVDDALETCDLVLVNGGSSKGSEDLALRILEEEGDILFHWVQSGPGRPAALARIREKPVIVVPGPPFGCLNVLDWFVRPVIAHWLHLPETPRPTATVTLGEDIRGNRGFAFLFGVELTRNDRGQQVATMLNFKKHGTARCLAADAIFRILPGMPDLHAGDAIDVTLLQPCV